MLQNSATVIANDIYVGIADIKVGRSPSIIKTTLGSCIGVCLYNAENKVGGMLHLMLADSNKFDLNKIGEIKLAKYADTGIPELLKQLDQFSKLPARSFKAKVVGGAKVIANSSTDIGKNNEEAVRKYLSYLKIPITHSRTGGTKGYRVSFDLATGHVSYQIFGEKEEVL